MFNYVNGITNHCGVELHLISQSKSNHVPPCLVDHPSRLEVGAGQGGGFLLGKQVGERVVCGEGPHGMDAGLL